MFGRVLSKFEEEVDPKKCLEPSSGEKKFFSPGGYLSCLHTGCACHVFRSEISLDSHIFGLKFAKMNFPSFFFLGGGGGKNFQQLS